MEVEPAADGAAAAAGAGADAAPESQQLVDELGQLLERLPTTPNNVQLLRRQVDLMLHLGMHDEIGDAVAAASRVTFLGEARWLSLLSAKLESPSSLDLDQFEDMLDLLTLAEGEYISVPILTLHARFLLSLVDEEGRGNAEVVDFLDTETLRGMLQNLAQQSQCLLDNGQDLWQLWIDWELKNLQASGDARPQQLEQIHDIYRQRLGTPHATQDATASAYSSFCSEHCVQDYEALMVQATEVSQPAKAKWEVEKRYGKTRSDFEEQLASVSDLGQKAQLLLSYIDWETNPAAGKKGKGKKAPEPDVLLTRGVFERAVLLYSNASAEAEVAAQGETTVAYKTAEALVWGRYFDWVAENVPVDDEEEESGATKLANRATRACPGAGELWVRRLLNLEADGDAEIETVVGDAKGVIVDTGYPVASLVDVLVAHAGILRRRYLEVGPSVEHPVFVNLTAAVGLVSKVDRNGDPSLRLEKFFVSWAEASGGDLILGVLDILSQPIKSRNSSYEWTIIHANVLAQTVDADAARAVYSSSIQRSDLDWPEAVYQAFEMFENVHGTLDTLSGARKAIAHEQKRVTRKREKQAAQEQAAAVAEYEAAVAAAPVEATAVAVDTPAIESTEVVSAPVVTATAAVPMPKEDTGVDQHVKRDREHTTVLVSGLKKGTDSARLEKYFEATGKVREVTVEPGDEFDSAMIEFKSTDSVPDALAKDGKKIDGNTVSVSMLWRSTLWVTNFSPQMDDAALRTMFGNYGKILDTRWPSRKYANDRRFCYITMESPAAAQDALALHKFKPDDASFPMTVLISDPAARTKRSDAPDATLFVGGLNPKTTEGEVRNLLAQYGTIHGIRLGWDRERKVCRGFAYVEMGSTAEATAALAANGTQYRGKGLKVEISDPKHKAAKREQAGNSSGGDAADRRSRTIYLHNLPQGTQEGLLQQELEKITPVHRVEVFQSSQHAAVELPSQQDAGRLRLQFESAPFVFNGVSLRIGESGKQKAREGPRGPAAAALAPQSSLGFVPTQRKKKGLGNAYHAPKAAAGVEVKVPVGGGQDSFRAFMNATNDARRGEKAGEKHADSKHPRARDDDTQNPAAKKPKTQ